jgi:hypothetical protein
VLFAVLETGCDSLEQAASHGVRASDALTETQSALNGDTKRRRYNCLGALGQPNAAAVLD